MTKITLELLRDINKDTIDFLDNYDGTEREPEVLPSRFPNLLVNGASGIAVGMATNIPPHNLTEVINGVLHLSKNPDVTIAELMEDIQGPDFPTAGLILGKVASDVLMKQVEDQFKCVHVRKLKSEVAVANVS